MVTKADNAVVETKVQLPAGYDIAELQADAKASQTMDTGDVALPYLYVLQSNSPQVNAAKSEYIEGAAASMFYNTVSVKTYEGRKEGIMVIPCAYERKYVEWVDRDKGGGWVGDHDINSDIMSHTRPDDKGRPRLPNGNFVMETAYQYVLVQDPETGDWSQACIPMKSTFLKRNKRWNNMIITAKIPGHDIQAPRYLFAYNLRTEPESKGENSWWNITITKHEEPVEVSLYKAAKSFAEMVQAGLTVRVAEKAPENDLPAHDPVTGEIIEEGETAF